MRRRSAYKTRKTRKTRKKSKYDNELQGMRLSETSMKLA